jgi:flagellar basal-body rod protein FlgF/flagellar basal-body rod protein FlgG
MDSGFYAACTALMSKTQALDSVANNLANVNTSGFRSERNQFSSVLANASVSGSSPLNLAVNNYGVLGGTRLDLSEGSLEKTGNDLDFAIDGPGFFVVQTSAGRMYRRSGDFKVAANGQLVTPDGDPVLGEKGPINVSGGKVQAGPDGTISVNGAVVGRLQLVDFPSTTQVAALGKTYYSAPQGSEIAAKQASIQQGVIESSNVNPVSSAVDLINIQRQAEMMERALSSFNNDLDKTATEDLPRVSS